MEQSYWQSRWDQGQIGFHLGHPHRILVEHLEWFRDKRVLVPLAGKTVDLDALAEVAQSVVANEFVERAARAWFDERGQTPQESRTPNGQLTLEHGRVRYVVGDFFELDRQERFDAVFDRAALVAIRAQDRAHYIDTLRAVMKPGAFTLLTVFEYDQSKLDGPPFSIDEATLAALFADGFEIEPCGQADEPAGERFQKAGITTLPERAYRVTRR